MEARTVVFGRLLTNKVVWDAGWSGRVLTPLGSLRVAPQCAVSDLLICEDALSRVRKGAALPKISLGLYLSYSRCSLLLNGAVLVRVLWRKEFRSLLLEVANRHVSPGGCWE